MTDYTITTQPYALTVTGTVVNGAVVADLRPAAGGGLLAANNLSDVDSAATSRTNLGGTATGVAVFTAANAAAAATAVGATVTGAAVLTAASEAAAQTAIGATVTGAALITAANAAAAATAVGATVTGAAVLTAANAAAAATAIGATVTGAAVLTAADAAAARTAIGAASAADVEVFGPITVLLSGGGAAQPVAWRPGFAGTITAIVSVVSVAPDAEVTITPTIAGGATTPATMTIANGAPPDTEQDLAITAGNTFTANQLIKLTPSGAAATGVATFTVECTRS